MQKSCFYNKYIHEKVIICTNTKKISGILDKITKEYKANNIHNKIGRGLL